MTFILDSDSPYYNAELKLFTKCFKDFGANRADTQEDTKTTLEDNKSPSKVRSPAKGKVSETQIYAKHLPTELPDTYNSGCNLWLLKPAEYNRGQGINLFNKLSTLEHYLKCSKRGSDNQKTDASSGRKSPKASSSSSNIVYSRKFVVQKYIERPLLIEGRKFDARVWVLVDQEMNLYIFKESYLRLSSEGFNLDETRIEDKYVHLTNNAIQKNGDNYGKHESGNIISLNELEVTRIQ